MTTEADLDPGSQLTAGYVSHGGPAGGSRGVNADKTNVSLNPGHRLHPRNLRVQDRHQYVVNLNSNITLTGSMDHNLSVDPTGKMTAENGLMVTDGTNPLGVGQTDGTGQIVVSATAPRQHQHAGRLGGRRDDQRLFATC